MRYDEFCCGLNEIEASVPNVFHSSIGDGQVITLTVYVLRIIWLLSKVRCYTTFEGMVDHCFTCVQMFVTFSLHLNRKCCERFEHEAAVINHAGC